MILLFMFGYFLFVKNMMQQSCIFLHFNKIFERQFQTLIKYLQIDLGGGEGGGGGEYGKLQVFLRDLGVAFRHPCPYTDQQ